MSEPIKPPEEAPTPQIEAIPPKKGINLKIVLPVIVVLIIVGAFAFSYIKTRSEIQSALDSTLQTSTFDYKTTNPTLFPIGIDVTTYISMKNPSSYDLDLKVEMVTYYDNTVLIPLNGVLSLPAGKSDVLQFQQVHFSSDTLTKFSDKSRIKITVTITATTKVWDLIPVTVVKERTSTPS